MKSNGVAETLGCGECRLSPDEAICMTVAKRTVSTIASELKIDTMSDRSRESDIIERLGALPGVLEITVATCKERLAGMAMEDAHGYKDGPYFVR